MRYFGSSVEELFSSAVNGTAFLIGEPGVDCQRVQRVLNFTWTDLIDLMYQLLDKIIYYFEIEEVLLDSVVSMDYSNRNKTSILLSGCRITDNFQYKYIMKAPTYHQMVLDPDKGYGIQIFDI